MLPERTAAQFGAVPLQDRRGGTHDAVAAVAVADREGHGRGNDGVLGVEKGFDLPQFNVPRCVADVVHAVQRQFQGATLGADHQVDARQVGVELLVGLGAEV